MKRAALALEKRDADVPVHRGVSSSLLVGQEPWSGAAGASMGFVDSFQSPILGEWAAGHPEGFWMMKGPGVGGKHSFIGTGGGEE